MHAPSPAWTLEGVPSDLGVVFRYGATSESKAFAVQVEALAMVAFLNAGDSGLNAHAIPSLFLAVALGTGSVGAMIMSFASQASRQETGSVNAIHGSGGEDWPFVDLGCSLLHVAIGG